MRPGASSVQNETFVRLGNSSCVLDRRADRRQVERLELVAVGDADRALRVADRDVLEAPGAAGLELADAVGVARREVLRAQCARGPCPAAGRRAGDRRADLARGGLDRERSASVQPRRRRYRTASRAPLPDSSASEPSGLKIRSRATKPGSSGGGEQQDAVGADAGVAVAEALDARRGQLERQRARLEDEVVVAERLPLLEAQARIMRSAIDRGGRVRRRGR